MKSKYANTTVSAGKTLNGMQDKPPQNESVALIHWLSNWTLPYTQKI